MSAAGKKPKVVVFTCGWSAHSSLDSAGRQGLALTPAVIPIRLSCLGRISPGIILKAYQGGAAGVCLLGCPDGECRYHTGNQLAQEVLLETRKLLSTLGLREETLQYRLIPAEAGERFQEVLNEVLEIITDGRSGR